MTEVAAIINVAMIVARRATRGSERDEFMATNVERGRELSAPDIAKRHKPSVLGAMVYRIPLDRSKIRSPRALRFPQGCLGDILILR